MSFASQMFMPEIWLTEKNLKDLKTNMVLGVYVKISEGTIIHAKIRLRKQDKKMKPVSKKKLKNDP